MKIELLLPIIGAALAVLAILLKDGAPPGTDTKRREAPAGAYLILAVLVGALILGAFTGYGGLAEALPVALSFGIGCLLSAVAYGFGLMKGQASAGRAAPIALGVLAPAILVLLPYPNMPLALVFGAAASAWYLSIGTEDDPNPWAMRAAVVSGLVVAMNLLGAKANLGEYGPHAGTLLGLAGVAGTLIGAMVARATKSASLMVGVSLASFAGIWWILATVGKGFGETSALVVVWGGCILALIVSLLIPEDSKPSAMRVLIASVIWISAGTASFGFERGFGVAVLGLTAAIGLLASGNRRALQTLGPLGALVMYRVFRETHFDATQAFDIGQHYAMIGLVIGVLLPTMAQEWIRMVAKRGGFLSLIAGALWIVVLLVAPIGAAVVLGAKGVVGYLFGLGLASLVDVVKGERSAHSTSLGIAMGGAITLMYDALAPHLDLERAEKLSRLAYLGGAVVILGVLIAVLSGELGRSKEGNA